MKNILIAGAGRGIGLSTARCLHADHRLVTISRQGTPELELLQTDFRQLDAVNDDLALLTDLPEAIHGLVYCPGSINLKPFHRLSADDFLNDYRQNVIGAVRLIQKVLPNLRKANGAGIVLFSSVAATTGMPFHASVAAAKSALEGMAKSLAAEYAPLRIRVNVISPSLTDTPLASSLLSNDEKKEPAAKRHPLQAVGNPDHMAALAAFLLSDESAWITGQVIGVDGGLGNLR